MLQAQSPWDIKVEDSAVNVTWRKPLSREEQISFNKTLIRALRSLTDFSMIFDLSQVATHNREVLELFNFFLDRLKVTEIAELVVLVSGSSSRHRVHRLISESLVTFPFLVQEIT